VVPPQLSGKASGANNTARQLGIATGIAGLGSIFQAKIESTLTPLVAGMPASSRVHELARAVASRGTGRALQAVPPADRDKVADAAHHAFVTGFNTIALVSVAVAAVGCVAGYALVRRGTSWPAAARASAPPTASSPGTPRNRHSGRRAARRPRVPSAHDPRIRHRDRRAARRAARPHALAPPARHGHPRERRRRVGRDRRERDRAAPGDEVVIPAGESYRRWNAGDEEARHADVFRPARTATPSLVHELRLASATAI
jgi:hypothetical protein